MDLFGGTLLQQVPYVAKNQRTDFDRQPIAFQLQSSSAPGVRLSASHDPTLVQQLQGGEDILALSQPQRQKITIRMQPVGYTQSSGQQKQRRLPKQCTRAQLFDLVATAVRDFIRDASMREPTEGYMFGPGHIELEDIVLVELTPVSPASYQPVLHIVPRERN